jgi:IS5 family transposase
LEQVVPWKKLCRLIEPYYPKAGNGRPPVGLERMLRIYFLQQWFNLSDPGVEDGLYESPVMRQFVGIDLGQEPAPDETTVCKFRHLLEEHNLGGEMLQTVNLHLESKGIRISQGTIVDATIIQAASSTKNQSGQRDPEMHQTQKGWQWFFGMKAHIGVDSQTKMIHSVVATAANQGGRQGAAAPAAWRGSRGVGRSGLRGADRGDSPSGTPRLGTASTGAVCITGD